MLSNYTQRKDANLLINERFGESRMPKTFLFIDDQHCFKYYN